MASSVMSPSHITPIHCTSNIVYLIVQNIVLQKKKNNINRLFLIHATVFSII